MAVATPQAPSASRGPARVRPARGEGRAAAGLLLALVVLSGYAAFAHGAIQQPDEARLQVLLALLALVAAGLWSVGMIAPRTGRAGVVGLLLLGAFTVWNGVTLIWSVAPDETWTELNRWIGYSIAAGLAVACGASVARAAERLAAAWLIAASLVATYALATKLIPGVHVGSVIDFNQEAVFSRLRAPLDYWNALALVCVLGLPFGATIAADRVRGPRTRLTAELALALLILVGAQTYSRGAVMAAVVVVIALAVLADAPLRALAALALAALAAVPPLAFAFTSHTLTTDGASLGSREGAGAILAAIVLASFAALLAAGRGVLGREATVAWSAARSRRVWRGLAVAAAIGVVALLIGLSLSSRGLTGSIGHEASSFTATHRDPITDPKRLLSTSSGNRWVWWKEAIGAWWNRPAGGWGAGSFPVVHLLYRKPPPLPVRQPHSVPLQMLAETGLVGAALGMGGLIALLVAALARARRMPRGRERDLTAALAAAAVAWLVHGLFDWDSDIPAVTLPVLLFLGVAAALPERRGPRVPRAGSPGVPAGVRPLVLGLASLLACAVAVSAILPAWSHSKASGALALAATATAPAQLQRAAQEADIAAGLNPFSDEPLLDAASIAQRRSRYLDERRYLLRAVQRESYDALAWARLSFFAQAVGDAVGAGHAAQRALELDPLNPELAAIARASTGPAGPPAASATAVGTPLGGLRGAP